MILRDYQQSDADRGSEILRKHKLLYVMAEVRTGKTATALTIGCDFENVLFVTKLKAIGSIVSDFKKLGYTYKLTTINYESLHKLERTDYVHLAPSRGVRYFISCTYQSTTLLRSTHLSISGRRTMSMFKRNVLRTA